MPTSPFGPSEASDAQLVQAPASTLHGLSFLAVANVAPDAGYSREQLQPLSPFFVSALLASRLLKVTFCIFFPFGGPLCFWKSLFGYSRLYPCALLASGPTKVNCRRSGS